MDYQEAIEYMRKELHKQCVNSEGQDAYIIAISAMKELQEYKQKLNNTYGECDDLLRTVVDGLVRHEGIEFGTPIKSRILTDDDVDLWEWYKQIGTLDEVREAVGKQKVVPDINVGEWIPAENPPKTDDTDMSDYVLLSFENFSIPMIGRYEIDQEGNGAYYVGDDDKSCVSYDMIVNAWMPLPEPYRPDLGDEE